MKLNNIHLLVVKKLTQKKKYKTSNPCCWFSS